MKSQANIPLNKGLKKRVFVGISGGVDSSVSAALLKAAGYEVTGVFIKVWQPDWLECTWREERRDAMRVAAHLGIPFVTLDLEKEYKRDVVDHMLSEYRAGRTPNPDVMCNRSVKFGGFYDWAMAQGADFVATGHYAQIEKREVMSTERVDTTDSRASSSVLLTSCDPNKDQSYFLWTLRPEQLPRILFPIGHLEKPEVRKLAKKFKLPTAEKKDSQGICFIGMVDMKAFLSHYIESKPGNVLDASGRVIGTHPGAVFFTIGERHGFTISKKGNDDQPMYVSGKDMQANTITVSALKDLRAPARSDDAEHVSISLVQTNWASAVPTIGKTYRARTRYRQQLTQVIFTAIDAKSSTASATFLGEHDAFAPGQSLVAYDGEICLGGGIIQG